MPNFVKAADAVNRAAEAARLDEPTWLYHALLDLAAALEEPGQNHCCPDCSCANPYNPESPDPAVRIGLDYRDPANLASPTPAQPYDPGKLGGYDVKGVPQYNYFGTAQPERKRVRLSGVSPHQSTARHSGIHASVEFCKNNCPDLGEFVQLFEGDTLWPHHDERK